MKITCQSCQAKYTIADEKVVGKTVKIKCKKCGAAIVVNANEAAAAADAHGHGQEPAEEDDGTTRVFSGDPAADPVLGGGPDWTVNVRDDDQRTMSAMQISAAFAAGTITGDTYVWRDGMADWQPLSQVAELHSIMSAAAAHAPAAAAPPPTDDDLNATVAMNSDAAAAHYAMPGAGAAPAAATPAAARKAQRGGQDLFGAGGGAAVSPFDASGGPGQSQLQKSMEQKAVGERNENSVLFSLSSLSATEKAAMAPDPKKKPARSGLDDIMNMGGGGGGMGAMLAPPPIMAPVIEPPPQQYAAPAPMPMQQHQQQQQAMGGSMPPPGMANAMMSYPPPAAQKKTPVGLIVGIVVGVLALCGVGVVIATSGGDKTATGENADANSATVAASAAPTNTAAAPKPTETVAANNTAPTNTAPAGDPATTKSTSGGTAPAGTGTGKPSGTTAPTASTAAPPTTAPTTTATAEPTSTGGGGAEFNRAAASSALNAAAGSARGCKKPDGPTGTAKVKVTFAPSGNVTTSQVQGAPFAGTPVGGCIAAAFRSAKVPPFEGSPVSVSKSVTIN